MKKKKIFEGKVLSLSLYDGIIEKRSVRREIIEHRGAAAILAIENGKIILVKQHRFPHGYVLEIPAGTMNKEETGYEAKKMIPLIKYYPSIGYNTELIHCYVAAGLKKSSDLKLDDDEILSVIKIDFKKVLRMILAGKITDSKTICAVLTYAIKKKMLS